MNTLKATTARLLSNLKSAMPTLGQIPAAGTMNYGSRDQRSPGEGLFDQPRIGPNGQSLVDIVSAATETSGNMNIDEVGAVAFDFHCSSPTRPIRIPNKQGNTDSVQRAAMGSYLNDSDISTSGYDAVHAAFPPRHHVSGFEDLASVSLDANPWAVDEQGYPMSPQLKRAYLTKKALAYDADFVNEQQNACYDGEKGELDYNGNRYDDDHETMIFKMDM